MYWRRLWIAWVERLCAYLRAHSGRANDPN